MDRRVTVEGKNQKVVKLVLHPNEKLTTSAYQETFDVRLTEDSYMNDERCESGALTFGRYQLANLLRLSILRSNGHVELAVSDT